MTLKLCLTFPETTHRWVDEYRNVRHDVHCALWASTALLLSWACLTGVSLRYRVRLRLLPLSAGLCERMSCELLPGLPARQLHKRKLYITGHRPGLPALPTALPDLQQPQPSGLPVLPPSQLPGPLLWHLSAPQPVHARIP